MIRLTLLLMLLICGALLVARPAGSAVEISCNGDACNLFGTLDYNYILINTSDAVTVTAPDGVGVQPNQLGEIPSGPRVSAPVPWRGCREPLERRRVRLAQEHVVVEAVLHRHRRI